LTLIESLPYQDYTVKAVLPHWEEVESKIRSLPATLVGLDIQHDTYFEVERGKLKWRKGTIENLITHYERIKDGKSERTVVYRYDLDPTEEAIQKLFDEHRTISKIVKERTIYWWTHLKIHLDKLAPSAFFIEIEAIDRNNLFTPAELKASCENLLTQLGIAEVDRVYTGYIEAQDQREKT
jgi:adenylate cyclase, class 2